jgi:hypothetical protein
MPRMISTISKLTVEERLDRIEAILGVMADDTETLAVHLEALKIYCVPDLAAQRAIKAAEKKKPTFRLVDKEDDDGRD